MALRKVAQFSKPRVEVRVYRDTEWTGEYRARVYIDGGLRKNLDYFTTDRDDAISTAKAMLQSPEVA
jgi:hypothetical protein